MKLSNQAMGALMMALQKCLIEERDIMPFLEEMNFEVTGPSQSELIVTNPPVVNLAGTEFADGLVEEAESEDEA